MENYKCCSETGTCQDIKIGLEIVVHQTNESIGKNELKLKQVEVDFKHKLEQLQDLKSKVNSFKGFFFSQLGFRIKNLLFSTHINPSFTRKDKSFLDYSPSLFLSVLH